MTDQHTTRSSPAHTLGTPRGEELGKPVDRYEDDATGINVDQRQPIDSRMPHLPPA